MRILTLLSGPESVPLALELTEAIRCFNAEIDFRLRFLHVEIEEVRVAGSASAGALTQSDAQPAIQILPDGEREALAAARLALVLSKERPMMLVIVGAGQLATAAVAAGQAAEMKIACFGAEIAPEATLDLGTDAAAAVDRLTGVAREIS
jgi:hypothetical protein